VSGQTFTVRVEEKGDAVRVEVVTPDGEVLPVADIDNPSQLLGFAPMFATMMATMVTQAIYEARG
jgi:hypothetical protein